MSAWGVSSLVCFAVFAIILLIWGILRGAIGRTRKQTIEEERRTIKLKKASRVLFFVALALLLFGILGVFLDHQAYMARMRSIIDEKLFG